MEELWKKFKEETQESMKIINEFLSETSLNEKSTVKSEISINQQVFLENESSPADSRKDVYGKLKEIVKEIMEKEHVSRAQAYRKARKRILMS